MEPAIAISERRLSLLGTSKIQNQTGLAVCEVTQQLLSVPFFSDVEMNFGSGIWSL